MSNVIPLLEIADTIGRPRRFGVPGSLGTEPPVLQGTIPQLPLDDADRFSLWPKVSAFARSVWDEPVAAHEAVQAASLECPEWRGELDTASSQGMLLRLLANAEIRDAVHRRDASAFVAGVKRVAADYEEADPRSLGFSPTLFTHTESTCIVECSMYTATEIGIDVKVSTGGLPPTEITRSMSLAVALGDIEFAKDVQAQWPTEES